MMLENPLYSGMFSLARVLRRCRLSARLKKLHPPTSQNSGHVVYGGRTVPSGITVHRGPMR